MQDPTRTSLRSALRLVRWRPDAAPPGRALEWGDPETGDGALRPDQLPTSHSHLSVVRTFCFADLSDFTAYTRAHGPHVAVERVGEFRHISRTVAALRGVRVAKWLGDGVMLVGVEPMPVIAWAAHVVDHTARRGIDVRVGLASGTALLFEGDDYIGEPVNLAAKLCAGARTGEILAHCADRDLPGWVRSTDEIDVDIRGVGRISGIRRLTAAGDMIDGPGKEPGRGRVATVDAAPSDPVGP